jgi:hypothetical protein
MSARLVTTFERFNATHLRAVKIARSLLKIAVTCLAALAGGALINRPHSLTLLLLFNTKDIAPTSLLLPAFDGSRKGCSVYG